MRYISVEKDGENYSVNTNVVPAAYCWSTDGGDYLYLNVSVSPANQTKFENLYRADAESGLITVTAFAIEGDSYTRVSDSSFTVENNGTTVTYTRSSTNDFILWELTSNP